MVRLNLGELALLVVLLTPPFLVLNYFMTLTQIEMAHLKNLKMAVRREDNPVSYKFSFSLNIPVDWRGVTPSSVTGNQSKAELLQRIHRLNEEQYIHNLELYGPVTNATHVIVVQVHTRLAYLAALLKHLSQVRGIEDGLLILSHDLFFPDFNEELKRIRFTRVMQIFYPHGTEQSHGNSAQMKLHWWWKANFVFHRVRALENFAGIVSFTEEDVYITENALWMLSLMRKKMAEGECGGCQALTLSEYNRFKGVKIFWRNGMDPNYTRTCKTDYLPSLHLSFNRTLWHKLERCADEFCHQNDYNWDWSLRHMIHSKHCLKDNVTFLVLSYPRVFHSGTCGHHHTRGNHHHHRCRQNKDLSRAQDRSRHYSQNFPDTLGEMRNCAVKTKVGGFEGWGEFNQTEDVQLCLSFTRNGSSETTIASPKSDF